VSSNCKGREGEKMKLISVKTSRWLGFALIAVAIVIFITTSNFFVDVPRPMEPSKPEFTSSFNTPFVILSAILALTGWIFLARSFNKN
jgi:hypothetical protein